MKNKAIYTLLLLCIFPLLPLFSQVKPVINYTEDDGLASNVVKDIIRDKKGILWIATDLGISKFDGEKFQNIYKTDGLPSNRVWALAVDTNNTIYAGCYQDGLVIIRNNSIVKVLHTKGKLSNTLRRLHYANYYKKLLIGTDYGIYLLQDTALIPVDYPKDSTEKSIILSISEHDSRIFFTVLKGKTQGLYELFFNKSQPERSYAKRIGEMGRFASAVLNDTLYSSDYNIIYKNPLNNINKQYSNSKVDSFFFIWNMIPLKSSELFMGGLGEGRFTGGISIYDTRNKRNNPNPCDLDKQSVNDIFYDSTSRVTWVCRDNGLTSLFDSPFESYDFKGIGNILDIGFAGDSMLVLTENHVYYFCVNKLIPIINKQQICSRVSSEWEIILKRPNHKSISLFDASRGCELAHFTQDDNKLYVNTAMGLLSIPDQKKYYPFGVGTVKFTTSKNLYAFVNYFPLLYYPNVNDLKRFIYLKDGKEYIQDILKIVESKGIYYFASYSNGLYATRDSVVYNINETNSSIDNHLTSIDKDVDGNVWCSSSNGNLFEIGFTDSIYVKRTLNSNIGIVGNNSKWLKFNRNYLFIGTNTGLNIITTKKLYSNSPRIEFFYNQYNGYDYISAESPIVDKNGDLFVHTKDKIIRVEPNFSIDTNLSININYAKINDVNVDFDMIEGKDLTYDKKQISFTFFAIKYPSSKNLFYRYTVNNNEWVKGNQVNLQSLRTGRYKVLLAVFDKETNTNYTRTLVFSIKKPLWLTWWFILLFTAMVIVFLIQIMKFRIKRLKKQHEEKIVLTTQNSELRLRSLQLQMNPHFIFNALNSVQGYIITQNVQNALTYIGNIASIIRSNLENVSNEYIHLSSEIEFLKKYAEIEKNRFKDNLQITFINNISDCNILLPPMLIQPIIENAVKHGIRGLKKEGRITVTFNSNRETLIVIIEDNGVGRKYAQQYNRHEHNGMGMKIIQERLTLLNEKNQTGLHQLKIADLFDNGVPIGTKVEIQLMLVKST